MLVRPGSNPTPQRMDGPSIKWNTFGVPVAHGLPSPINYAFLLCPRTAGFPSIFACDTLTLTRIIDAMSLKMCPLGPKAALLLDTQRSLLCVPHISEL